MLLQKFNIAFNLGFLKYIIATLQSMFSDFFFKDSGLGMLNVC